MPITTTLQEMEFLEKNITHIQHDLEEMNKRITILKHSPTIRKKKVIGGDQKLIALIGTQPTHSLPEEKMLIREAIGQRYKR